MFTRKRKISDNFEKAIVITKESHVLFRKQFVLAWRETLTHYQNRPFVLAADPEGRLLISWTDQVLQESEEPKSSDVHYTLKAHVTGQINREFWHSIYCYVTANFPLVFGHISFETGTDGQPHLKFYAKSLDSSLMLVMLIRWKDIVAETVNTGPYILTVLRLNKLL
jgi:hypothetical protein